MKVLVTGYAGQLGYDVARLLESRGVSCRGVDREEFDLTERLICPGMTDEESARYWQSCRAKLLVIKHGMKGSSAYTCDGQKYSIKPFPVSARKGFGGGDGYAAAFLYGLFCGWDIMDCLEFGSAEASMMVRSNNCSDDLPGVEEVRAFIEGERAELAGNFCRGCGYCMPCPAGITINQCARMSLMIRRAPSAGWLGERWQAEMAKIENCLHCNRCASRCPYELDTPSLLEANLADYRRVLAGEVSVD